MRIIKKDGDCGCSNTSNPLATKYAHGSDDSDGFNIIPQICVFC